MPYGVRASGYRSPEEEEFERILAEEMAEEGQVEEPDVMPEDLFSDQPPIDVFEELKRRYAAAKGAGLGRYASQMREGFEPDPSRGRVWNAVKYFFESDPMNPGSEMFDRNLALQAREQTLGQQRGLARQTAGLRRQQIETAARARSEAARGRARERAETRYHQETSRRQTQKHYERMEELQQGREKKMTPLQELEYEFLRTHPEAMARKFGGKEGEEKPSMTRAQAGSYRMEIDDHITDLQTALYVLESQLSSGGKTVEITVGQGKDAATHEVPRKQAETERDRLWSDLQFYLREKGSTERYLATGREPRRIVMRSPVGGGLPLEKADPTTIKNLRVGFPEETLAQYRQGRPTPSPGKEPTQRSPIPPKEVLDSMGLEDQVFYGFLQADPSMTNEEADRMTQEWVSGRGARRPGASPPPAPGTRSAGGLYP